MDATLRFDAVMAPTLLVELDLVCNSNLALLAEEFAKVSSDCIDLHVTRTQLMVIQFLAIVNRWWFNSLQ